MDVQAVIRSKKQMYALYQGGAFGNKLRTWNDLSAFYNSGFGGSVTLRYAGAAGGGFIAYDVPANAVRERVAEWEADGADANLVRVNEGAPDECLVAQGEVARGAWGFVLRYSTARLKMREAMKWAEHTLDLDALVRLRHWMSPSSYDDVMTLLDMYDDAVVEFGVYAMSLGDCRGRNTVIWEVRNY